MAKDTRSGVFQVGMDTISGSVATALTACRAGLRGQRRLFRVAAVLLLAAVAAPWSAVPVAAAHDASQGAARAPATAPFGGPFVLTDHTGRDVSDESYRGKLMVIYFGYTHCPDICPLDAANIAQAMDLLGDAAGQVRPIFITIDPARDTPGRLAEWLAGIHPSFVGLTGSEQAIARTARAFQVVYEKVETADRYDYVFGHPGLIYVMGKDGQFLFLLPTGTPPEVMAAELRPALAGGREE